VLLEPLVPLVLLVLVDILVLTEPLVHKDHPEILAQQEIREPLEKSELQA
jgi:hypothetical protein